jgi:D-proline reductase (dithiol) PrdB
VSGRRVDYIPRTRELYAPHAPYRWADNRDQPVPWTPLRKPVADCRVMLVSSSGVHLAGQPPFRLKDDTSIRLIPADATAADLRVSHFGYPTAYAERDPNCVFPLERLRELAAEGAVGAITPSAVTCMGGIYSHRAVVEELAPEILARARDEHADVVYLVPA